MRQPPRQEWSYRRRTLAFFPSLSFLTVFDLLVLHLARVSITACSMRQYLDPTEVAQVLPTPPG